MTKKITLAAIGLATIVLVITIVAFTRKQQVSNSSMQVSQQLDQLATWRIETPLDPISDPFGECKTGSNAPISKYTQLNTTGSSSDTNQLYTTITNTLTSSGWTEVSCQDTQSHTYQKSNQYIKLVKPTPNTSLTLYLQ